MRVYLDNAASTRMSDKAIEAMIEAMRDVYGNASSGHGMGAAARGEIEKARDMIGDCLGVESSRIVFTSGATEANNMALHHYALEGERIGKRHIVVSAIEHPSVMECCLHLKYCKGFEISIVRPNEEGVVCGKDVEREIRSDTCVVCVMAVNNEVGSIQPIADIQRSCKEKGVPLHCDATQAAGHGFRISKKSEGSFSLSAHKFHGPKGVGVLVLPKTSPFGFHDLMYGGSQEHYHRPGTENVAGIVGAAVSLVEACKNEDVGIFRDQLYHGLRDRVGGVLLNGNILTSTPNILNVSFEGVQGDVLVSMLSDLYGVYCSTGSACCSGERKPSSILKAMGFSDERSLGAVRFSFSRYTTEKEIDFTISAVQDCVSKLRGLK